VIGLGCRFVDVVEWWGLPDRSGRFLGLWRRCDGVRGALLVMAWWSERGVRVGGGVL